MTDPTTAPKTTPMPAPTTVPMIDRRSVPGGRPIPLRVVYFDHCAKLGGAEIALLRVLGTSKADGATLVLGEHGPLAELARAQGVRTIVRPLPQSASSVTRQAGPPTLAGRLLLPFALLGYALRLAVWLRAERPEVVHLNSLRGALIGGVAARLAGVPAVWHAHDTIDETYLPGPLVTVVRLAVRALATAVVANSHWTLSTLHLSRRFRRNRTVAVVPPPLPLTVPRSVPRSVPPQAKGPAAGGTTADGDLLMVGRLAPWKGQDLVIEALATLTDLDWQMRFVGSPLFGEDDYAEGLTKRCAELGIGDRVTFVPFLDDVTPEYGAAGVLIHYSRSPEPFGMVVVEGMSHGLAVVAVAAGGPAEVIDDHRNGLLVPPEQPAELAAALRELLGDPALRQRLGQAALENLERFSPATIAAELDRVHRAAAGQVRG